MKGILIRMLIFNYLITVSKFSPIDELMNYHHLVIWLDINMRIWIMSTLQSTIYPPVN